MKRNLITITSRMISLLMIINLLTGIGGVSAAVIRIEAEDAVFGGEAHVFTNMPGASGNSLVGDIHKAGCYVQLTICRRRKRFVFSNARSTQQYQHIFK